MTLDEILRADQDDFISTRSQEMAAQPAPESPQQPMGPPLPDRMALQRQATERVMSGPGATLAAGLLRGAAGTADSAINAGRYLYNKATGQSGQSLGDMVTGGDGSVAPLGNMVKEYIDPNLVPADGPVNQAINSATGFVGEMAAPLGVGIKVLNKGVDIVKNKIPSGWDRLNSFLDLTKRGGTGAPMLPEAVGIPGMAQNAAARVGAGALAGGTMTAAGDLDNPQGAALGALVGGVAGPALSKVGDYGVDFWEAKNRARDLTRVPELAAEALRGAAGNRTAQIRQNLGMAPARVTAGVAAQNASDPGISAMHRYLASKQPTGFGSTMTDFLERQQGELTRAVKGASDLPDMKGNRARAATIRELYDDTGRSFSRANGEELLDQGQLAKGILKLQQKSPEKWDALTSEQRRMLTQVRKEADHNADSLRYGSGSAADEVVGKVVPEGLFAMTKPMYGPLGRTVAHGIKAIAGKQVERVDDELARLMSSTDPAVLRTIDEILAGMNKPRPQATGKNAQAMHHLLSVGVPGLFR